MTSIVSPRGSSNEGMTTSFRMDTEPRFCKRWLAFALILPALSCGGGTKNPPATTTPPPPPVVSVQLNQTSATISTAGTQQFTATVTGTSNTAVTWSVNSTTGGSSNVGTVSSSGLYTAPAQFGSYTVTATSVADTSKNASAAVTVLGSVAITPANAVIGSGATQQFSATVQGESTTSFAWTVGVALTPPIALIALVGSVAPNKVLEMIANFFKTATNVVKNIPSKVNV